MKHGATEPVFGVRIGDMKKIVKKIKKNHELSLELFDSGNGDAMYFAGLIADETKISKKDLDDWAKKATWYMISEFTVAWVASESKYGFELGQKWIQSKDEQIASCGWSTLSSLLSIKPDAELDIAAFDKLLDHVGENIHNAQNRVRYTMNGFVIAVASYVPALTKKATKIAQKIGKVDVEMGGTSCKVPLATEYIQKVIDAGRIGKKRKMARC
jgi:3-methyladenine DNA glycosylase AlkD